LARRCHSTHFWNWSVFNAGNYSPSILAPPVQRAIDRVLRSHRRGGADTQSGRIEKGSTSWLETIEIKELSSSLVSTINRFNVVAERRKLAWRGRASCAIYAALTIGTAFATNLSHRTRRTQSGCFASCANGSVNRLAEVATTELARLACSSVRVRSGNGTNWFLTVRACQIVERKLTALPSILTHWQRINIVVGKPMQHLQSHSS
jgi:hypothetical protein